MVKPPSLKLIIKLPEPPEPAVPPWVPCPPPPPRIHIKSSYEKNKVF